MSQSTSGVSFTESPTPRECDDLGVSVAALRGATSTGLFDPAARGRLRSELRRLRDRLANKELELRAVPWHRYGPFEEPVTGLKQQTRALLGRSIRLLEGVGSGEAVPLSTNVGGLARDVQRFLEDELELDRAFLRRRQRDVL